MEEDAVLEPEAVVKEEPEEILPQFAADETGLVVDPLVPKQEPGIQFPILGKLEYPSDECYYPCYQCDYVGKNFVNLRRHKQLHDGPVHFCDECDYSTIRPRYLKMHKQSKHEGVDYSCDQCTFRTHTPSSLKRHIANKHDMVKFPCDLCDYSASRMSYLKMHKESKHEGILYPCDLCEFSSTTTFSLKRHKETRHDQVKYPCDQCDFITTRMSYLKSHKEFKHEGITYPCDQCTFSASTRGTLKRHREVTHEGKVYLCESCPYVATRQQHLTSHVKSKHNPAKFNCSHCKFSSNSCVRLENHLKAKHAKTLREETTLVNADGEGDQLAAAEVKLEPGEHFLSGAQDQMPTMDDDDYNDQVVVKTEVEEEENMLMAVKIEQPMLPVIRCDPLVSMAAKAEEDSSVTPSPPTTGSADAMAEDPSSGSPPFLAEVKEEVADNIWQQESAESPQKAVCTKEITPVNTDFLPQLNTYCLTQS